MNYAFRAVKNKVWFVRIVNTLFSITCLAPPVVTGGSEYFSHICCGH